MQSFAQHVLSKSQNWRNAGMYSVRDIQDSLVQSTEILGLFQL
jgi:hypothetical protein